jgi:hypothetical protein
MIWGVLGIDEIRDNRYKSWRAGKLWDWMADGRLGVLVVKKEKR